MRIGIVTFVVLAAFILATIFTTITWGWSERRDDMAKACPKGMIYLAHRVYGAACVQGFYIDYDGKPRKPRY